MSYQIPGEDPSVTIERLLARIHELEDVQQRVEANAAESIRLTEELESARARAEEALRKEIELKDTIEKMALFDTLTGLANRHQFHQRFDDAISMSRRMGHSMALLVFDLDKFKRVNDTFGHPTGDALLCHVAEVLKENTRDTDTVARFGGDEFAVILTGLDEDARARLIAQRIVDSLSHPITIDGALIETGTSIGISLFPRDGDEFEELMRTADAALYRAKREGRSTYRFYDNDMEEIARQAHILESDLRLAIVRNEFCLHYQPQFSPRTGQIICIEAFMRWQHPARGLLYPGDFIACAESSGLLINIGEQVLLTACKQCREWVDGGLKDVRISVNVSGMQFRNRHFVQMVTDALQTSGLPARNLEIEITEAMMMEDMETTSSKLDQLQDLGVHISIDDFGTGYSSLSYLRHLPVSRLKIDKSFVNNLIRNENDMVIAQAIVRMGQTLGLEVVAEGIETALQAQSLMDFGCEQFQGYHITEPLPARELSDWMTNTPVQIGVN